MAGEGEESEVKIGEVMKEMKQDLYERSLSKWMKSFQTCYVITFQFV